MICLQISLNNTVLLEHLMYLRRVCIVHIEVDCQQHLKAFFFDFHWPNAALLTLLISLLILHKSHHLPLRPTLTIKKKFLLKRERERWWKEKENKDKQTKINLTSSSVNNPTYLNSVISLSSNSLTLSWSGKEKWSCSSSWSSTKSLSCLSGIKLLNKRSVSAPQLISSFMSWSSVIWFEYLIWSCDPCRELTLVDGDRLIPGILFKSSSDHTSE